MTHACSTPDPVFAAVERHRESYFAVLVAQEGIATLDAEDEYAAAGEALLRTACQTFSGALALSAHLHWWLDEAAAFTADYQPLYRLAEARAADLALFVSTASPPVVPTSLPPRRGLPPARRALNLRRALRPIPVVLEGLSAIAIVAGGIFLSAFASLL